LSDAARDRPAVTIGIVAGEASGDALGAELIRAVRARLPDARFAGIGGPRMEAAGCLLWYPHSELALRGYAEVITHLPALLRIRSDLFRRLASAKAPLFVGIDAPDFNLGLEARLKRRRVRTIHYVSPSVWAWRRDRIGTIARSVDHLLALFPFEPPLYADAGISKSEPLILRYRSAKITSSSRQSYAGANKSHRGALANVLFDYLRS